MNQFVVEYLDDILIFLDDLDQHTIYVCTVLERQQQHSLYDKHEKCTCDQTSTEFLGFILLLEGIKIHQHNIQAVCDLAAPCNVHNLQCFLGFANFYQRFISNFSKQIKPPIALLCENAQFHWSLKPQHSFKQLKLAVITAPVLSHPNMTQVFIVESEASSTAIRVVLSKRHRNKQVLQPITYYSRKLIPAKQNYKILDKDLFAIKIAFEEWQHYFKWAHQPVQIIWSTFVGSRL